MKLFVNTLPHIAWKRHPSKINMCVCTFVCCTHMFVFLWRFCMSCCMCVVAMYIIIYLTARRSFAGGLRTGGHHTAHQLWIPLFRTAHQKEQIERLWWNQLASIHQVCNYSNFCAALSSNGWLAYTEWIMHLHQFFLDACNDAKLRGLHVKSGATPKLPVSHKRGVVEASGLTPIKKARSKEQKKVLCIHKCIFAHSCMCACKFTHILHPKKIHALKKH